MTLTESDVNKIRVDLEENGVTLSSLRDDLLDHLCCDIEHRMKRGEPFDHCLNLAIRELAPGGLKEIEHETILLLNNKLIPMKKVTYLIGLVSSMMMTTGWVMSILHWPGAFNIGTAGLVAFFVLFLPLFAASKLKSAATMAPYEKTTIVMSLISGFIMALGALLKIMHMPGANLSIVLGTSLFAVGYLPFLFFGMYKKSIAQ